MSLARLERSGEVEPAPRGEGPEDRVPPQDVHAEQSVLGSMLLSKDAIADCIESTRGVDFYRPAHETIFDAVLDLYGRGEPADAITVADELTKRGELGRIGGQAYLHQLISAVPTAANAGYYAQIVAERAVLRRLVDAGTRIVQMGYGTGGGDVEEIVNAAQAEVYQVADKRGGEDYHLLGELLEATADEIEHASGSSGEMVGVPTGFTDLDDLTNGLHPGQMIVIAARPAMGKALALDTELPTPTGWTTMGEVQIGDEVLGADGRPTAVVAATDVMTGRPCYELQFSDGATIVADEEHQWFTETRASRKSFQAARDKRNRCISQQTFGAVRTTAEIAATLRCDTADRRLNHSVPLGEALQFAEADLPVGPYTLGAWLGDGSSASASITVADVEIVAQIELEGYVVDKLGAPLRYGIRLPKAEAESRECVVCGTAFVPRSVGVKTCGRSCGGRSKGIGERYVRPSCPDCGLPYAGGRRCRACTARRGSVQAILRTVGVLGNKHIPATYQRASETQRRALLAGLLDTDGTVSNVGCPQVTTTSPRLAEDIRELIVGLGYRCSVGRKRVPGRTPTSSTAFTLTFSSDEDVFRLERKKIVHKELRSRTFQRRNSRFITAVEAVESVPVRCIQVAAPDHLYLAGRSMIPTHNSTLALDIARAAAIKNDQATVVFSLEMSRNEITMRLLSAEASIQLQHMRKGTMRDDDWAKLARTMGEVSEAPLFIDDSPNMSLMEIRAKCRRLKQRHNLKLVIIDYLQLMSSGKRVESRQQEVSEFSRALKLLAKEIEVPVIALSQLNRGPEQRTDKRPQVSDLRESGCLPACTRIVRADTGAEVTMGELFETGARDVPVWALDDSLRYVPRHLTHVFRTGTRDVYRLTTASGKVVRATDNHPFLTYGGWAALGDLRAGDRIAVPRHVPAPSAHDESWSDEDVRTAAGLVAMLPEAGIPADLFSVPKRQIALFLRELFTRAGGVLLSDARPGGEIFCFAADRASLDRTALLLLRFGISSHIDGGGDDWVLDVVDLDSQRRFLQEIGIDGPAAGEAERLLQIVRVVSAGDGGADAAARDAGEAESAARMGPAVSGDIVEEPLPLWQEVAGVVADPCDSGSLRQVSAVLDRADLDLTAVNDVEWDPILDIAYDGTEDVFDATVLGTHNFIADGIAVHNSIEQDADMVMLLHRESVYEPDSPREGEADIIVAKHRNGPTATITVAFQGHYSRFTNMATNF
ncbi:replicative DNA helicase [Agilicoccus flavus]|uniref:replicative DNA helicase n=1 Tax=Agilicoccus flavus TaxID=2775968 RepID=UPI001CF679C3|nr:replicative DNA helicase [Agilicoccus flavus]